MRLTQDTGVAKMPWVQPSVDDQGGMRKIRAGIDGPVIHDSGTLKVQWPDGTEEELRVCGMHHVGAKEIIPALKLNYHGSQVMAPLHLMSCRIWTD